MSMNDSIESHEVPLSKQGYQTDQERAVDIIDKCKNYLTNPTDKSIIVDITEYDLTWLIEASKRLMLSQPNLLRLRAPINFVGDIHGQYLDLLRIFELTGWPNETPYLFLGDYVDRGKNGLECCILLLALKILYPDRLFMIRGNHECASINRVYGFYEEVKRRYTLECWSLFCDLFDCLPVAAVVEERVFCIHGGLSPEFINLEQIEEMERPIDVPDRGMMCDFLWSDPDADIEGWAENDRGVSHTFGEDVVEKFLLKHDLDLVVRAHQVVEEGYEFFGNRKLVTLFSAPNYCGEFDNAGAVMLLDANLMITFKIIKPTQEKLKFIYEGRNLTSSRDLLEDEESKN